MRRHDLLRYGLWVGIAATADANRRHYRMTTTWLPHLLTNTVSLLLPDVYRALASSLRARRAASASDSAVAQGLDVALRTLAALVHDNPRYVAYVTPLAAGYLLSHPDFNIYKGELGELELGGFGLDAIPHSATAFALTTLICDAATEAGHRAPANGLLGRPLCWCNQHPALFSAAVLALATAWWEAGEYLIYRHEIGQRGEASKINMQWSPRDTLYDCVSNALGWVLAIAWGEHCHRRRVRQLAMEAI